MPLTLGLGLGLSQQPGNQWQGNETSQNITDESDNNLEDESAGAFMSSGD